MKNFQTDFDKNICANLAQGKDGSIEAIFAEYFPRLVFFSESLIHNREEARDIAQEALMQLWNHRAQVAGWEEKNLAAYVFVVARHKSYDYLRRRQVRVAGHKQMLEQAPLEEQGADMAMIYSEGLENIRKAIGHLPERIATVLNLSYIEGFTTREIASQLKITSNLVRVQRSRGIEKLRNALSIIIIACLQICF